MNKFQEQLQQISSLKHSIFVLKSMVLAHGQNTDINYQGFDDDIKINLERLETSIVDKEKALRGTYGKK